jgi:RNA polymerase sigma-70 factor (ECF subfamily)
VEAVIEDSLQTSSQSAETTSRSRGGWRALFDDLAAGRASALEALYDLAAPKLYGLALWRTASPDDAADVVQDVFVRVAEQGAKLAKIRNPKGWLLTVTHRAAVDVTRRRRRRSAEPLEECPFLAADDSDNERMLDAARASVLLAGLPEAHRDVIYLRHFAECTFAEIGEIVRIPKFTAASRYRNGIQKLRKLMEGDHDTR